MIDMLTISEVARRSGVPASALRYYDSRGLIHSQRAGSGHRRYHRSVLRRVAFIVFAQRVGLSLEEIAAELSKLPTDHAPCGRDWSKLSRSWTASIDCRIAELQQLREGLSKCIGCGCLSLEHCKLANPNDRAAGFGAGPYCWNGPAGGRPTCVEPDNPVQSPPPARAKRKRV